MAGPNILVIVTDDQGYADLSAYEHRAPDVDTPNMDRLARGGVLMPQAYVTAPVCSPSRAGWNTGRYQERWDRDAGWSPGLPEDVKTLAEYLKAAGYVTGKAGKSDYGTGYFKHEPREYPLNHGYDEFLGFSAHAHDYFLLSEDIERRTPDPYGASAHLGRLLHDRDWLSVDDGDGYTTDIFSDAAIDFMRRHREGPFFFALCYNSAHHLIHEVPQKYLDEYRVERIPNYDPATMGTYRDYYNKYNKLSPIADGDMRGYYLANLKCMDDNIGRVLDAMDDMGLGEDTLVIFFSDNGGSPLTGASNRPLAGSKYNLFEGGIRVPFAMRWPGVLPEGHTYDRPVSTLDILPTCLAAAGVEAPEGAALDGVDVGPGVKSGGPAVDGPRRLFWRWKDGLAVREGDWKLVRTSGGESRKPTSRIVVRSEHVGKLCLFNVRDDPGESTDLIDRHPETAEHLQALHDGWWRDELGHGHESAT